MSNRRKREPRISDIFDTKAEELSFNDMVADREYEMKRDILPGFYTVVTKGDKSAKVYSKSYVGMKAV